MKAYIHYSGGKPRNDECATAERGFENLGIECVQFSDNEGLEAAEREDIVVAGMLVSGHALSIRNVKPPSINYPDSLSFLLGRKVWECDANTLTEDVLPAFVKPLLEKDLPGLVARETGDLAPFLTRSEGYRLLCSEPVGFVSEWRVFVRYGKAVGMACYRGPDNLIPSANVIEEAIDAYEDAPAGYAVDLGVTDDGKTLLVEVNDGFALGCYGVDSVAYALLLSARWAELVGEKDRLRHLNHKGAPVDEGLIAKLLSSNRLSDLLARAEGSNAPFRSVACMVAIHGGVDEDLSAFLEVGSRSVRDVWEWLAQKMRLTSHRLDGIDYVFPRVKDVRFVVDTSSSSPLGSSSLHRYSFCCAVFTGSVNKQEQNLCDCLYSLLLEYAEVDAKESGYSSMFVLMCDGDANEEATLSGRGFTKAQRKDEDHLERALGAHVLYDFVMEKDLR